MPLDQAPANVVDAADGPDGGISIMNLWKNNPPLKEAPPLPATASEPPAAPASQPIPVMTPSDLQPIKFGAADQDHSPGQREGAAGRYRPGGAAAGKLPGCPAVSTSSYNPRPLQAPAEEYKPSVSGLKPVTTDPGNAVPAAALLTPPPAVPSGR